MSRRRFWRAWWSLWTLLFASFSMPSGAQLVSDKGDIPREQQVIPLPESLERTVPSIGPHTGTFGPVTPAALGTGEILPFGANLFSGGFRGVRASGLNPAYQVMPGDQVTVRAWGALELDRVFPVDAQGNIFVPQVGPVQVQGVSAGELDKRVKSAIGEVFTDNVSVYTNLQGVQPVAVFVTGYVKNPGRYAGIPGDSVLNFLDQASGIDIESGSFRDIRILRNGKAIATVDLYAFLLRGELPRPQFAEGDTIVVGPRGPMVTVTGDVSQAHRYELVSTSVSVGALLDWVQLKPGVSHALINGVRGGGPFSAYLPLDEFRRELLRGGDEILFSVDQRLDTIVVQVEGSYEGPTRFTVPTDARLMELLDSIPINPRLADVTSVSVKRKSVALRQRESLRESLRRLEAAYLGASSATAEEAEIRVKEAALIQDFVKRAELLAPTGRLVVARHGEISNIGLQDGDIITIPNKSDALFISGEILVPQAMVFNPKDRVDDYIRRAGGLTERADSSKILIARQNGEVVAAKDARLRPGDEILVLPAIPSKNLQVASVLAEILYNLAVTTRVVLDIGNLSRLN